MNKSLLDTIKNTLPFFTLQFKLKKDGYWHTVQKPNAGDHLFPFFKDAILYLDSTEFQTWHPLEVRICEVKIMRYKKLE